MSGAAENLTVSRVKFLSIKEAESMLNILIHMYHYKEGLDRLKSIPDLHIDVFEPGEAAPELPAAVLRKAHILFCMKPPENFSIMENLRLIQLCSSGYAQLFNLGLVDKGIRACNARGVFDIPIAEWSIAMMINLARDLRGMIHNQESRIWERAARFQREIRGSKLGIWGYGGIGRETARLAKAMGMQVSVMTRRALTESDRSDSYHVQGTGDPESRLPDSVYTPGQEEAFLHDLDFLTLCMPLTSNTEGLIGERELQLLPRTAFVLNPARGPIIQEEALLTALREHWIAGAAIDTHYHYPMPPDHPLWGFPQVIMTPHISGSTLSPNFNERNWDIFFRNVTRYIDGKPLLNELSISQLRGE